jgi:hypothetical protein
MKIEGFIWYGSRKSQIPGCLNGNDGKPITPKTSPIVHQE